MRKTYKGWFGEFSLDPSIDFYGDNYWRSVADKTYEPDTMAFLENNLNTKSDFIDVGAATGAMSIIAAKLGARVLSFEAVPRVFDIAKAHVNSNSDIASQIFLQNKAISNYSGILEIGNSSNPKVLASISDDQPLSNQLSKVPIVNLIDEIDTFHRKEHQLVLKIDIEGAEWQLLYDREVLDNLVLHNALILLAIHPGFNRPFKVLPFGLTAISKKYWQLQNLLVAYRFFQQALKLATIQRTNLDKIQTPKKCILLMFGGYFEFILNFAGAP